MTKEERMPDIVFKTRQNYRIREIASEYSYQRKFAILTKDDTSRAKKKPLKIVETFYLGYGYEDRAEHYARLIVANR